ncbi:hypothetical protein O7615_02705 [Micromonospora sp. WMMD1082]|nr:hypothetical protein [Micromonospora sp. WMMD1082]MDG4792788.1 hypothetical protein [Micromonospora sp. WMMD1082]
MPIVNDLPAVNRPAQELEELDRRMLLHPHQSGARRERCVIVRGPGCTVWGAHGTELLDVVFRLDADGALAGRSR